MYSPVKNYMIISKKEYLHLRCEVMVLNALDECGFISPINEKFDSYLEEEENKIEEEIYS